MERQGWWLFWPPKPLDFDFDLDAIRAAEDQSARAAIGVSQNRSMRRKVSVCDIVERKDGVDDGDHFDIVKES